MKVYDQQFNQNEWFIVIVFVVFYLVIFFMPRRFSLTTSMTLVLVGIYIGMLSDHTISIPPFDFYDVNDNSSYQFFDFLTYVMYGPFGYIYCYIYDYYKFRGFKVLFYMLFWAGIAMLLEYTATKLGVFHYKQGYRLLFSLPIYLGLLSITLLYFDILLKREKNIYFNSN
ncbi:hypothetical protein ACFYKX_05340 [Cytobacillus sp. FJAT-54145]|uniref:Uncharacterized protein n=1 Tax=Cytobacillus spartinae TaxID=3299023 RepID=A0ABW6K7A9_9BACI